MTYEGPYKLERAIFHEWGRWAHIEWYKDVRRHWFPAINPIYWMMLLYGKRTEPTIYTDEVRKFNMDEIEAVNAIMEQLRGTVAWQALKLRHHAKAKRLTDGECAWLIYGECDRNAQDRFRYQCEKGYRMLMLEREAA